MFLGNILVRFDTFHKNLRFMIKNNGTVIKKPSFTQQTRSQYCYATIGCSAGWNYGMHSFVIKCRRNSLQPCDIAIGIITSLDEFKQKDYWFQNSNVTNYTIFDRSIYVTENKGHIHRECQKYVTTNFKSNNIITMNVVFDDNGKDGSRLTFLLNDE